jgi:hypothetical protein
MHVALHDKLAPHHHDATGATIFDDHGSRDDEHDELDRSQEHADADHHEDDDDLDAEIDEHGAPIERNRDHEHHVAASHDRDRAVARLAAALAHGQHSLAHHTLAVPSPPLALTTPLPVSRRPTFVAITPTAHLTSLARTRAVARGPPAKTIA